MTVVIIGFTQDGSEKPRLYNMAEGKGLDLESGTGFEAREVENILPNNLEALPTAFVSKRGTPISELPKCAEGNKFADGENLVIKTEKGKFKIKKDCIIQFLKGWL